MCCGAAMDRSRSMIMFGRCTLVFVCVRAFLILSRCRHRALCPTRPRRAKPRKKTVS